MTTAQIRALERWCREVTAVIELHPGVPQEQQQGVCDALGALIATLHPSKRATNGELPLGSDRIPRINLMFGRKASKPLSATEEKFFHAGAELCPTDEFESVEAYYSAKAPYCRRDVETLLRNWDCEVDRARAWAAKPASGEVSLPMKIRATQELLADVTKRLRMFQIPNKLLEPVEHLKVLKEYNKQKEVRQDLIQKLHELNSEAAR